MLLHPVSRRRLLGSAMIIALCAFALVGRASDAIAKKVIYPGAFALTTGQMTTPRFAHTATLLNDGAVLITGGEDNNGVAQSNAELYNPTTRTFALTAGVMDIARVEHTATLLNDGTVLITGGESANLAEVYASADIYNPATGLFTLTTTPMTDTRAEHTATLLQNGEVLITGGLDMLTFKPVKTAELYDPTTKTFTALAATMSTERLGHTATLLQSGEVLIAGGQDKTGAVLKTAELYDPTAQTFTLTAKKMTIARTLHTATLLNDGEVLLASGFGVNGTTTRNATLYDPATNKFLSAKSVKHSGFAATATLLGSGDVLRTGGYDVPPTTPAFSLATSEAYAIATKKFEQGPTMAFAREGHTATLLQDGTVLVAGGASVTTGGKFTVQATAEIFTPQP
ncbi:MAG TPA: kelch repeat-containing protein [Candidatus Binataceae bacterium]|nr:kelch repeat-containing protein [Candidatus Binataceae bacterium]